MTRRGFGDFTRVESDGESSRSRRARLERTIEQLEERQALLERENQILLDRLRAGLVENNRIRDMIVQESQQALLRDNQIHRMMLTHLPWQSIQSQHYESLSTSFTNTAVLPTELGYSIDTAARMPSFDFIIPPLSVLTYGQRSTQRDFEGASPVSNANYASFNSIVPLSEVQSDEHVGIINGHATGSERTHQTLDSSVPEPSIIAGKEGDTPVTNTSPNRVGLLPSGAILEGTGGVPHNNCCSNSTDTTVNSDSDVERAHNTEKEYDPREKRARREN